MLCLGACGRKGDLVLPDTASQNGESGQKAQKEQKEQTERPAQ
jgi:predicted small lipoprotein YifL